MQTSYFQSTIGSTKVGNCNCCNFSIWLSSWLLVIFFVVLWLYHAKSRILVPWLGIKPAPPAVEARSLNHWTDRKLPLTHICCSIYICRNDVLEEWKCCGWWKIINIILKKENTDRLRKYYEFNNTSWE